jgi:hypothetical protein
MSLQCRPVGFECPEAGCDRRGGATRFRLDDEADPRRIYNEIRLKSTLLRTGLASPSLSPDKSRITSRVLGEETSDSMTDVSVDLAHSCKYGRS